MKVYTVNHVGVINMSDTVLTGYDVFKTLESAIKAYPDHIMESDYESEDDLEKAIEKELTKMFSECHVISEITIKD